MNLTRSLLAAALITVTAAVVAPVQAAPAAADTDTLGGKLVPGVCMLSREAVFAQSKVGQAASKRLAQLAEQARSGLETKRKPLDADIQAFQEKAPSLSETQRKQQGAALAKRMQDFQQEAGQLNQRVQLTRAKIMQRIGADAQPLVSSAYKRHQCGLLLDRDSVLGGNTTNDLTGEVVQGLDRKTTSISFNLEPAPSGK